MAREDRKAGRTRAIGRREAIALCGLLAGMASAALLTQAIDRQAEVIRPAI